MIHLPHRNHKNSIWKWSEFHLKNWLSPKKLKKVNKKVKMENSKKKPSRAIVLRNMCTKFGADWKIFRYTNDDTTETVTELMSDRHISYWSFRCQGGLKSPEKKFKLNRRK